MLNVHQLNKIILLLFLALFLPACGSNKMTNELGMKLGQCDMDQQKADHIIFPGCYFKTFKEAGWSKKEVKKYIKEKYKKDLEEFISTSPEWNKGWQEAYGK